MSRLRNLVLAGAAAAALLVGVAGGADGFEVRKMAETASTITLGWDQQAGDGYRFYANGVAVSRTFDPSRTSVRFGKTESYGVTVLHVTEGTSGSYPPPPPPPPGDVLPPGSSWDAAADSAACGKTFLVDGSYPQQTFTGFRSCAGNPIRFVEVPGGRAVVGGGLGFQGASDITVVGVETAYRPNEPGAGNQHGVWVGPCGGCDGFAAGSKRITLENIDAGSVDSWFATDVKVLGGDFGPCLAVTPPPGEWPICGNNKSDLSRNVLIDGAFFHDYEYDESAPGAHYECMYVNAAHGFTIRNTRFERCAVMDLFLTLSGPDARTLGHRDVTIGPGNYFGPATDGSGSETRGWSSLAISWCQNAAAQPGYRNVLIHGNNFADGRASIERDLNADAAGCSWENVRVEDNLLGWTGGCQRGWLYARNTWVGSGSCG